MTPPRDAPGITYLYRANVQYLYPRALYLIPNRSFVLTLVVEQEPLKLFPVYEMTTESQRSWLFNEEGIQPSHVLPYIVQCRGAWLPLEMVDGGNSKYIPYFGLVPTPDDYGGTNVHRESYFFVARRAFTPRVDIYVSGQITHSILAQHALQGLLPTSPVSWRGNLSCTADLTMNNHPHESLYGFAPSSYPGVNSQGYLQFNGGGGGVDWVVTYDGYGRMIVTVASDHRNIELRCSCEQVPVPIPGEFGTTAPCDVTDWREFDEDGHPVAPFSIATYHNPVAFHWGGGDPDLAAHYGVATNAANGRVTQQYKASTEYTASSSESTNNTFLDWDSIGPASYANLHTYRRQKYHETQTDDDGTDHGFFYNVASPLLVGVEKPGGPFTLGIYTGTADESEGDTNAALIASLEAAAMGRIEYNRPLQGPRIKITAHQIIKTPDDTIQSESVKHFYANLPYHYTSGMMVEHSFEAFVSDLHPNQTSWSNAGVDYEIVERDTKDGFNIGSILAGKIYFNLRADNAGFELRQIEGADSTALIYEGPDSYIYYPTDPGNSYAQWAAEQGL